MKKFRNVWGGAVGILTAGAMVMGMLAGCAKASDTTSEGAKEEVKEEPEKEAKEGEISLVWATFKGEWVDILNELFDEYKKEHPEIKEITVYTAASGSGNLFTDLKAMLASGTMPNIINMRGDSFGYQWKEYLQDISGSEAVKATKEEFVEPFQWDGGTYGAYWNYEVQGVAWNMPMLKEAGISEVPVTLTDYKAALEAVKNTGANPLLCCYGVPVHFYNFWGVIPLSVTGTYEDNYNGLVSGAINPVTDPNWAEYYDLLDLDMSYCQENALQTDNNMASLSFANNEYAAYPSGGTQLAVIVKEYNPDFARDYRIGPVCPDDENAFYPLSVQGYSVTNTGDEATNKAARELLDWFFTSDEVSERFSREVGVLRTSNTFVPTEELLDAMTYDAYMKSQEIPIRAGRYFAGDDLNNEWAAVTQKYVAGEMTREEALKATGEVFRTYGKEER